VISCQDADVLAAALSVGAIDAPDQAPLQHHLSECADCRRVAGEYLAAAARLPIALEPMQPSPELRGRLMRAVYAEAEQAGRRVASAHAAPWWRRLWTELPGGRGFTVLAAGAMAALIAVTSWSVISRQSSAPAAVTVPLAATASAPQARGQLVYQRGGGEAVLTVTGLPPPVTLAGGGAVYEVWLVRPDGSAVAAAYLSHQPDGTWSAAVPGDMSRYSKVAATVEPPGGSSAPSGVRVIQATLTSS
jgi:anti-sigma-K factor RskA